jgi:hypothetical protein
MEAASFIEHLKLKAGSPVGFRYPPDRNEFFY